MCCREVCCPGLCCRGLSWRGVCRRELCCLRLCRPGLCCLRLCWLGCCCLGLCCSLRLRHGLGRRVGARLLCHRRRRRLVLQRRRRGCGRSQDAMAMAGAAVGRRHAVDFHRPIEAAEGPVKGSQVLGPSALPWPRAPWQPHTRPGFVGRLQRAARVESASAGCRSRGMERGEEARGSAAPGASSLAAFKEEC